MNGLEVDRLQHVDVITSITDCLGRIRCCQDLRNWPTTYSSLYLLHVPVEETSMIRIPNSSLWLGNASDLEDVRAVLSFGVTALIDLATEVTPPRFPRTIHYCRFALTDDGTDQLAAIRAAVITTAAFMKGETVTAVCCNAGMNRSPTIAAFALSRCNGKSHADNLRTISNCKQVDVHPGFWNQVLQAMVDTAG